MDSLPGSQGVFDCQQKHRQTMMLHYMVDFLKLVHLLEFVEA